LNAIYALRGTFLAYSFGLGNAPALFSALVEGGGVAGGGEGADLATTASTLKERCLPERDWLRGTRGLPACTVARNTNRPIYLES